METAGEERVRAGVCLRQLEEAAILLEDASKSQDAERVSPGFPGRLSGFLHSLTAISSRDDAERLLATGVSMWNAVIVFEGCDLDRNTMEAMIKVRHVAADCMYMATTVLGGISARYNIDDLSLLKFYTVCGQKYATELNDMDMADVCFSKGAEFVEAALNESVADDGEKKTFAQAMFDLLLGRAECAWEKGKGGEAERFVNDSRKYMLELPGEFEFLASVEYNFGLFSYQAKDTERALRWLESSMETRGNEANASINLKKQAKTARLAGVCLLALQDYDGSFEMMSRAEKMSHDPVGSYLLLKLSVITKKPHAHDLLLEAVQDNEMSLEMAIASTALFADAQRISDASTAYEHLFERFQNDPTAFVCVIGPRYFESLAALGKVSTALKVLDQCHDAMIRETAKPKPVDTAGTADGSPYSHFLKWSALLLATGSSQADQKKFVSASIILDRSLSFAKNSESCRRSQSNLGDECRTSNVVLENEAAVCRLAASCALCSADILARDAGELKNGSIEPEDRKSKQEVSRDELLRMCLLHAQRAKELDRSDFAPRLLLFRAHLVDGNTHTAAAELRDASSEIRSFDPGALAEAACAARDVGATSSVVGALLCVLKMDSDVLTSSLTSSTSIPEGFFGKILLSSVHILSDCSIKGESLWSFSVEKEPDRDENDHTAESLLEALDAGLRGIQTLGRDVVFGTVDEAMSSSLTYLVNVCWNTGRKYGMETNFKRWEWCFDMCFRYSALLPTNTDSLQTRRMSKLMCAASNIENPESDRSDYLRAREQVKEARTLSQELREHGPAKGVDPIEGLLLILESRCCAGCGDIDALTGVVDHAICSPHISAAVLEQLAAVCHNCKPSGAAHDNEARSRCTDLTCALLSKASDFRLCNPKSDLPLLAMTMREHLSVEMSRGTSASRAYKAFTKAIGVALENCEEFPVDERRWLVAVGWDRAQMYERLGQSVEAKRWCEGVKQLAEGCAQLATYIPRMNEMLSGISGV